MAEHYAVWLVDRRGGREAGWEAVTASGASESRVTLSLWSPPSGALVWLCPRRPLGEALPHLAPPFLLLWCPPEVAWQEGGPLRTCRTVWGTFHLGCLWLGLEPSSWRMT